MKYVYCQIFRLIPVLCFIVACNVPTPQTEEQAQPNKIVFIFDTLFLDCNTIPLPGGAVMEQREFPVLSFSSDNGEHIKPFMEIKKDTLVIEMTGKYLIVNYRNNPLYNRSFIANNGDTVFIRNKKGRSEELKVPKEQNLSNFNTIQVLNRGVLPYDLNYDEIKDRRFGYIEGYPIRAHVEFPVFLRMLSPGKWQQQEISKQFRQNLQNEAIWLDSLHTQKLLSDEAFNFYSYRNKYTQLRHEVADNETPTEKLKEYLLAYNDSIYENDLFGYYRVFYIITAESYYTNRRQSLENNTFDYRKAYEEMESEQLLSGLLLKRIRQTWLLKIIEQSPIETGKIYYEKMLSLFPDSISVKNIKDAFGDRFDDNIMKSSNLELCSQDGNRFTLESFVQENKGKVIYIDFWASWCIPCLSEMPESQKLRKSYIGKDVVFVYLAYGDKRKDWEAISNKDLFKGIEHNYLILNTRTAPIIKDLKISSIPRYLLYDKSGSLVHVQAPKPGSTEIRKLIDRYLMK